MSKPNLNEALTKYVEEIQVPNELDQRIRQNFKQYYAQKEKSQMKLTKKILAFSIMAAVLIPTGVYAFDNSYFNQSNIEDLTGMVDNQVKQAAAEGLTVPIDYRISDQGITIHFTEVYAEDSKVLVHYQVEKADGTLVPYEFDTQGLDIRTDGKKNGQQFMSPTYNVPGQDGFNILTFFGTANAAHNLPFYLTDSQGNQLDTGTADADAPEGLIGFDTLFKIVHTLPQEMVLHVNVNRIGGTKGSWQGQLPINQLKASTPDTK
jgi:hypothetical protein